MTTISMITFQITLYKEEVLDNQILIKESILD